MKYEEPVYRPPSEASSLIIQVTIGCSYNRCTFCGMYKAKHFRIRSIDEILSDLDEAAVLVPHARRIFLGDGNALCLPTRKLLEILSALRNRFPGFERVSLYASPKDILLKTPEELQQLKEAGLGIIYLGIESGSPTILDRINKGAGADQQFEAGQKVVQSGIPLSVTLISGLGGKSLWEEHASASADLMNKIQPDYIGLLTLMINHGTVLYDQLKAGQFELLHPIEVLAETRLFVSRLKLENCLLRSNHASNYVHIGGQFPGDKERILSMLDQALEGSRPLRSEFQRGL